MAPETKILVSADAIVTSSFYLLPLLQTGQPETGSNTIKDLERLHPKRRTCKELLIATAITRQAPAVFRCTADNTVPSVPEAPRGFRAPQYVPAPEPESNPRFE